VYVPSMSSSVGVMIRVSQAMLRMAEGMLDWFWGELKCRWDMPCYKGSAYRAVINQCKITVGCASLHFMPFTFILKLHPEVWFYKVATEVRNYPVYLVRSRVSELDLLGPGAYCQLSARVAVGFGWLGVGVHKQRNRLADLEQVIVTRRFAVHEPAVK
jgi:hypothetical protein